MTRVELASKANVSINTLRPLFSGTWKGIRRGMLDALCKAFSVRVGDLFEYVEMEEQSKKKVGGAKTND
jgi:DNA-binding Xre family transcriptional regulator